MDGPPTEEPHLAEERPLEPFFGANEIDFDDDRDDDQLPLDVVEAAEAGVLLDDPEAIDPDDLGEPA